MLSQGPAMIRDAWRDRRAIAAFSTYTLESTLAICRAAERTGQPVLIQAGASAFRSAGRRTLAAVALEAAREAAIPVGVHLDHSRDPDEIRACIALGYSSVMIDGSHLPFDENVALTRTVVEEAHAEGVWVEAELGALAGDEDASGATEAIGLTEPEQAADFAHATGVDALAVAIGTVHGFTTRPVHVDLERLDRIAAVTPVPLVLHGASGLPDHDVQAAVRAGMAKVNINAELRRAYLDALAWALAEGGDDIAALQTRAIAAMIDLAAEKQLLLADASKDEPEEDL
jgi:ketose-bisphosphate aldolase